MSKRGINKVILIGNVGEQPEFRTTNNGATVATLSLATSETWKDKNTGHEQQRTEWHNIKAFNRLAEIIREFVQKGMKIYIEGSLRTDSWNDRHTGEKKFKTEIIANELQILSKKGELGAGGVEPEEQAFTPARSPPKQNTSSNKVQQQFYDDDIPF